MKTRERTLIELQAWVDKQGEGMSINYCSHNPTIINEIPHRWVVQMGRTDREHYVGYGTTMEDAVVSCYTRWKNDIQGMSGFGDD